ncbi:putative RNA editing complex protein MP46 [Trypanosoma theileri]|uniref:Putative RNA editing complex protein MP46 n=1 Tax=Trypanosoma theileri TaxID=67003 RepID=A0A1X0P4R2_9TRYP|nr:putative RNA editing complex protein MP46 [Trypanosoma theileri]ORC91539.1 putative RNA editing complex protein MP46 [Trypanosoma theileri]
MRRGFARGVRYTAASVLLTATRQATCLLCDVDYTSWGEHSMGTAHIARSAICRTYVAPERHNSMMQQLWKHIRLDFGYIDDVTHKKEDHRRGRLASTMRHLREQGVLRHSLPQYSVDAQGIGTFRITKDTFVNFMLVGESYARQETMDRVARLMPRLEAVELSSVVQYILSKRRLARLFDELTMQQLITHDTTLKAEEPRDETETNTTNLSSNTGKESSPNTLGEVPRLRQDEKAVMLMSCLGELQMYARQDRSHSVATRAAAEQLVLNVLGSHVMENIIAELVHAVLQSVVEEGTPVWRAHCSELSSKLFEGTRSPSPSLSPTPTPPLSLSLSRSTAEEEESSSTKRTEDLLELYALDAEPTTPMFPPTAGRRVWSEVTRALALELTVPNPVNKSAVYAQTAPRLAVKKKA